MDNEGSASSLVKGISKHFDAGCISHLAHLLWARLGCRVWIEWINTKSNPADGLSRDGLLDAWTRKQGWALGEGLCPNGTPWTRPVLLSRASFSSPGVELTSHSALGDCVRRWDTKERCTPVWWTTLARPILVSLSGRLHSG